MQTDAPNVSNLILSQIASWGIKNMYGVAGDAIISLLDAIQKQDKIRYVAVRHESAAAFMASAEAKCTGNLAVCIATSGPGLVNMLNGIADAAADHVPMLVITGQVKSNKVGTEAKQYVNQQQMIAPLAVYTTSLLHPDATINVMNKAIIEAITKKGVAHISVPKDVLSLPCPHEIQPPIGILKHTKYVNLSQFDQTIGKLNATQKPIIYIGLGARSASAEIIVLAEKIQAGVIETLGAKGIVPASHPLYLGGIGEGGTMESSALLKQSDCILVIGANWYPSGFVPNQTDIIKIDISPGNIDSQRDITCGIVGDAAEIIPMILNKIKVIERPQWMDKIAKAKALITNNLDKERQSVGPDISPQMLIAAMEEAVAEDAIISLDTGDHTLWFNRIFRAKQQQVLFSGKWRTMGFGLPAAISAQLHYPNKEVVALVGDGSFAMTMMELSTVVKYNVPVKIIIANNHCLGAEKSKMTMAGLIPFGVELTNPNFAFLANSYGIKGIRIEKSDQLSDAFQEMFDEQGPFVLDVVITDLPPPLTGLSK